MLDIRAICENCGKTLKPDAADAMICSFECTFCSVCVADVLHNVCPNCGGGFEKRPVRPKDELLKQPPMAMRIFKPIDNKKFESLLSKYRNTDPGER